MAYWRLTALVLLVALVGVPLTMPFIEAFHSHSTLLSIQSDRLLFLFKNTIFLIVGTLALAMPLGIAAAVVLYRTDLPGGGILRFFIVLTLFVPLAVLTTAWQTALGSVGLWTTSSGRPWAEGLGPAIWIHAQAALPWVILIVGQGLRGVEPELEEDALLAVGPWRVLWRVTLPRCRGAIVAAGIWVALQAASEIAVADLMLVDTLAREVYNQFSLGQDDAVARALLVSLPLICVTSIGLYWVLMRLDRLLPPLGATLAEPRPLALTKRRWPLLLLVTLGLLVTAGIPLGALVWKSGLVGYPPEWSLRATGELTSRILQTDRHLLLSSIATMFLSAALVASTALVLCWLAQGSAGASSTQPRPPQRFFVNMLRAVSLCDGWPGLSTRSPGESKKDAPSFRRVLFVILAVTWSIPGPIIGIGLKETILVIVENVPLKPLAVALYDGPSPLPTIWAHFLRFLPLAVVVFWPAARLIPRELRDSIQIDGASPAQELRYLIWPMLKRTWLSLVVVVAALALGEIGAVAMRVETPGWHTFAHVLFDRMHYGQATDVAALCLVLITIVATGGIAVATLQRILGRS